MRPHTLLLTSIVLFLAAYTSCVTHHETQNPPTPTPTEAQLSKTKQTFPDPEIAVDTTEITEANLDTSALVDTLNVLHAAFADLALERARLLQEKRNLQALVKYANTRLGDDEVWEKALAKQPGWGQ